MLFVLLLNLLLTFHGIYRKMNLCIGPWEESDDDEKVEFDLAPVLEGFPELRKLSINTDRFDASGTNVLCRYDTIASIVQHSMCGYKLTSFEGVGHSITASALLYLLVSCPRLHYICIQNLRMDLDSEEVQTFAKNHAKQVGKRLKSIWVEESENLWFGILSDSSSSNDLSWFTDLAPFFWHGRRLYIDLQRYTPLEGHSSPNEDAKRLMEAIVTHMPSLRELELSFERKPRDNHHRPTRSRATRRLKVSEEEITVPRCLLNLPRLKKLRIRSGLSIPQDLKQEMESANVKIQHGSPWFSQV